MTENPKSNCLAKKSEASQFLLPGSVTDMYCSFPNRTEGFYINEAVPRQAMAEDCVCVRVPVCGLQAHGSKKSITG